MSGPLIYSVADMESYVVRIYRREDDGSDESAGTVDFVGSSEQKSFRNWEELREILRINEKKSDKS